MTAFEDRTAQTALKQIAKYGKTVTLQRAGTRTYDTASGTWTGSDPAPETVKALVTDFQSRIERVGLTLAGGDKMFLFAAKFFNQPSIADRITVDSKTYTIVPVHEGGLEIQVVYAGEIPVLYKVHGRAT